MGAGGWRLGSFAGKTSLSDCCSDVCPVHLLLTTPAGKVWGYLGLWFMEFRRDFGPSCEGRASPSLFPRVTFKQLVCLRALHDNVIYP